jgi:hypothetical protein
MTSSSSSSPESAAIHYPRRTLIRAERAVRCAPFRPQLYAAMRWQGVDLATIAGPRGVQSGYTRRPLPELMIEDELGWLIQTGLLRREVDGQGLTNSFRLTPLGRQLVDRWDQYGLAAPTWGDRLLNFLNRWVRLPSWV